MGDDRLRELAECLKQTVHLSRAYAHETGILFEEAMTNADRLADRTLLALNACEQTNQREREASNRLPSNNGK